NAATIFAPDVDGALAGNASLIGSAEGITNLSDLPASDIIGRSALLSPLGNYGGPTQTMPLQPGSPPLAAGAAAGSVSDQRGTLRSTTHPDIGAVEGIGYMVTNTSSNPATSGSLPWAVAQADQDSSGQSVAITFSLAPNSTILLGGSLNLF